MVKKILPKNITFNLGNIGKGIEDEEEEEDIFKNIKQERKSRENLKDLPQFGSATLKLPPFFAIPTKKGWKLANPLTEIRNLAKRQHKLSINIKRSNVNKPELDLSVPRVVPTLEDFSSKDRKKLEDYYKAVNEGKEEEFLFKNKPRGFPVTLYKNAKKAGYKETKEKVYRKNVVKSKVKSPKVKVPTKAEVKALKSALEFKKGIRMPKPAVKSPEPEGEGLKIDIRKLQDINEDNDNGDDEGTGGDLENKVVSHFKQDENKLKKLAKAFKKHKQVENEVDMGGSLLSKIGSKLYKGLVKPKVERVKKNIHRITHPRETIKEAKDFTRHLIHGRHDAYPPSAQKVIDNNKSAIVQGISLHRNPLPSTYTKLMSWATNGETDKRIAEQPKDTLYHIGMWVKLSNGKTVKVEKNEVINIEENPTKPKEEEVFELSSVTPNLTFGDMLEKTRREIGDHKYFSYSAKDNNCGNYIENILKTNRMDNEATHDFINQDTKEILKGFPSLRKFINTITDIGGRANVLLEGGDIDAQSQHFQQGKGVNIIDWEDMKWGSFTKQFEEYKRQHPNSKINDLEHFAESILANPEDYKKTTLKRARFYINVIAKKKKSNLNNIMPIQGGKIFGIPHPAHIGHPALVSDQYPRNPQAFAQVHLSHPFPIGNGLYAGGSGGRLSLDEITGGARHMLGLGIPPPHSRSPITDPSLLGSGLLENIGRKIKRGVEKNMLGAKQMSGGAVPSPHSRSPITDPSASGLKKSRPVKGSAEAKAWGEKMRALRKK